MITIEDAKRFLEENRDDGAICPCCGQMVKVYRRRIYRTMALQLKEFAEKVPFGEYARHDDVLGGRLRGGDFVKLRHWMLIEAKSNDDPTKSGSASYRLTPLGASFVRNEAQVAKFVKILNGKMLGFEGEYVTIKEILGKKADFDVREVKTVAPVRMEQTNLF